MEQKLSEEEEVEFDSHCRRCNLDYEIIYVDIRFKKIVYRCKDCGYIKIRNERKEVRD